MSSLASILFSLQTAATTAVAGTTFEASGWTGTQMVRIANSTAGTATVVLEGSFGGTVWHAIGYYRVDGQATLTRLVSAISVGANASGTDSQVLQIVDAYPFVRARISVASSGPAPSLDIVIYACP